MNILGFSLLEKYNASLFVCNIIHTFTQKAILSCLGDKWGPIFSLTFYVSYWKLLVKFRNSWFWTSQPFFLHTHHMRELHEFQPRHLDHSWKFCPGRLAIAAYTERWWTPTPGYVTESELNVSLTPLSPKLGL